MADMEFTPTPVPDHLDPDIVAAIPDDVPESALVGYVVDQWKTFGGERATLAVMPTPIRAWYLTFVVDSEVLNGGSNQLFYNETAAASEDAAIAFETVGLPLRADLMRRALGIYRDRRPALDAAKKRGSIEAFMDTYTDNAFAALDAEYIAHETDFRVRRVRFLRQETPRIRHP